MEDLEKEYMIQVGLGLLPSREEIKESIIAYVKYRKGTMVGHGYSYSGRKEWDDMIDHQVNMYITEGEGLYTYYTEVSQPIEEKVEEIVNLFKRNLT